MALIGGLALAGGGYDVSARHIAGLLTWGVVVILLLFGAGSRAAVGRPLYLGAGLIGALALLSAMSSLWSGSAELSVLEADRVLVYLGMFLAALLIAQTVRRRQRFAEGLAISVIFVAGLALYSRLLPELGGLGPVPNSGARLLYPFEYWNANAAMFGIGTALLLWLSRNSPTNWLRWLAAGSLPAVFLALYLTYSRGGLLLLAIASLTLLALSRNRLWLAATLAIGGIGALPGILAAQARPGVADFLTVPGFADQGPTVLLFLAAGTGLALLLFALQGRIEARGGELTDRAVRASRDRRLLVGVGVVAALVGVVAAIAVGGEAWDRFTDTDIELPARPTDQFSNLSSAGRSDFWRVALDSFGEEPLVGHGAGTYEFSWERMRSIEVPLHDAHSLYLETLSDLGIVGGLLVLALVGYLLWTGFAAWRAERGPLRDLYAAMAGAMLALAVGFGFDWFWELPGLGAVFFAAAGVVVAGRCGQIASARGQAGEERGWGLAVASVAIAWISAIALIGPLLVDHELGEADGAAASGDLAAAVDHAERARSIEPWAATPYVKLGLLAQVEGDPEAAVVHFSDAIEREENNWQWYYLRSKAEREAGNLAAARRDLDRARTLNPLQQCLRDGRC